MRRDTTNQANGFTAILLIAILINIAFYGLPDTIFGVPIKKVDLLSDIRITAQKENDPELLAMIQEDVNDNVENTSQPATSEITSESESQSKTPPARIFVEDINNKNIEDFTTERNGLQRFFTALDNIDSLGRPVRIAFVGDSFIEGDILVADFRAKMQEQFGGRGVGFIPVTSVTAQYRTTVKQSANGWKTYSIIKDRTHKYVISGMLFEPSSNDASIQFQTVDLYPGLEEVSSVKFIYSKNESTEMILKWEGENYSYKLPKTDAVRQLEMAGQFTKGTLQFKNSKGLKALGIALEDNRGVVVDNLALRGNSGLIMSDLDVNSCHELKKIRPYDLIILQFGLNVANDSVSEYSWYRNRMVTVIEHIRNCFPSSDILVLGVSDRSHNNGGTYTTMPAVLALLRAQRQMAISAKVTFWSIFAAMGGQNSMVKYVNNNWASKDHTHLSFRGGREIAHALYDALINEKGFYDSEKLVE